MRLDHFILSFTLLLTPVFCLGSAINLTGLAVRRPEELPGNWPRPPWTFAIAEGFIEFEYYGRRLRDPTRVITTQIERSLVQIKSSILQTFEPSGEDTWTCRRGVANFVVHLEPDNPATGLEIYNLFCWMHYLIRRWDDTSVEIGGAVLFLRGKLRAYCSLTLPGVVTVYGHQDQTEGKAIERRQIRAS